MVSDRIVTADMCRRARERVERLGARPAMVRLSKIEPELVEHVNAGMDQVWEKLLAAFNCNGRLCHAVDETLYPSILALVISSLDALREGHRTLWQEK